MITYIIIMAVCLILSAYFSATETAFSSVNKTRLKALCEKGNKKADRVLALTERYDRLISTILIGNNIVNILLSTVGTLFFVRLMTSSEDVAATVSTAETISCERTVAALAAASAIASGAITGAAAAVAVVCGGKTSEGRAEMTTSVDSASTAAGESAAGAVLSTTVGVTNVFGVVTVACTGVFTVAAGASVEAISSSLSLCVAW